MTTPTLTEQPWLANDLANIADDIKSLRRHFYHLIADCFVSTTNHTVRSVREIIDTAPATLQSLTGIGQGAPGNELKQKSYGSVRMVTAFATGFTLALLLRRPR